MKSICSIALVDSQILVRKALANLIQSITGCRIIGQASEVDEALSLIKRESPDLVILELALCGKSGIELLHSIKKENLDVKTLCISQIDCPKLISKALVAGADGFLSKSCSTDELLTSLKELCKPNSIYLSSDISKLVDRKSIHEIAGNTLDDPLHLLSKREREIFFFLADGLQNSNIAKKLFISPRTVETHRARIVRKLGIKSNGEIIHFALKNGLITI